jgi:hypothetical protein
MAEEIGTRLRAEETGRGGVWFFSLSLWIPTSCNFIVKILNGEGPIVLVSATDRPSDHQLHLSSLVTLCVLKEIGLSLFSPAPLRP